jgi:superfamily I DNA and/or RNA helicase
MNQIEQQQDALKQLMALWEQENQTVHERFVEERQQHTLSERVAQGVALRDMVLLETDAAVGGRVLLWIAPQKEDALDDFRIGPGAPVRLWTTDPDGPDAVVGTVSKRKKDKLGVVVDDFPELLEDGGFHLDRDEPQATFERGKKAISRFRHAEKNTPIAHFRSLFYGDTSPSLEPVSLASPQDTSLNPPQRQAIKMGLGARDLALIHGPPGTGKTRTLVELIVQAVRRGERVLATAASNAAVDNLAERLLAASLEVVRLGHPARVSESVEAHTLDAILEATEEYKFSRKWIIEANDLRRKIRNRRERGELSRQERREMVREMRHLFREARKQRQGAQEAILARAQVICATAAGADVDALGESVFDLVVLDEATQAPDPIALVPFTRAKRIVMAGDPQQLPPTVIDVKAAREGLGTTFFERLAERTAGACVQMLTVQYRMHQSIMAFPSQAMYDNRLEAAPGVAEHTLADLPGVQDDPLRPTPFLLIDSAGKGWEEAQTDDDPSVSNPEQAERTAAEVRRLLSRGLAPEQIAIIAPYDAQVRLLRALLVEERQAGLEVNSVDGFQGREKEAIVFDLVRSNDDGQIGFLRDTRRMNVALTRARRCLFVIGDSATLSHSPFFADLLDYAEQNGMYVSAWNDDAEQMDEEQ